MNKFTHYPQTEYRDESLFTFKINYELCVVLSVFFSFFCLIYYCIYRLLCIITGVDDLDMEYLSDWSEVWLFDRIWNMVKFIRWVKYDAVPPLAVSHAFSLLCDACELRMNDWYLHIFLLIFYQTRQLDRDSE